MSFRKWISERINQDRTIFLIYLLLIAIPMLRPIGLPLPIEEPTRKAYELLEKVPKGGVIVLVSDEGFPSWAELGPGEIAVYRHAFRKVKQDGCKVIMLTCYEIAGMILGERALSYVDLTGLKYGEDWVQLGYIPGYEAVLAAMMSDLKSIAPVDKFGTPTKDIPMLKNINSIDDYDLLYACTYTAMDVYIRQWGEKALAKGVPIVINMLSGTVPLAMPYYRAGTLTAYLNSVVAGAGYELLIGQPGMGAALMDAQSTAHILAIGLIIFVQGLFILRLTGGRR
ncbi:hypothetical protein KEJ34_08455 [Candidatus Bathyarchaeota archaeon]|nr:hypothetical protein [Candidatus Bathyarchaeota archaeon]